jgi:hypothetical protein
VLHTAVVQAHLCEEHVDLVEQGARDEAGKEHNDDLAGQEGRQAVRRQEQCGGDNKLDS